MPDTSYNAKKASHAARQCLQSQRTKKKKNSRGTIKPQSVVAKWHEGHFTPLNFLGSSLAYTAFPKGNLHEVLFYISQHTPLYNKYIIQIITFELELKSGLQFLCTTMLCYKNTNCRKMIGTISEAYAFATYLTRRADSPMGTGLTKLCKSHDGNDINTYFQWEWGWSVVGQGGNLNFIRKIAPYIVLCI